MYKQSVFPLCPRSLADVLSLCRLQRLEVIAGHGKYSRFQSLNHDKLNPLRSKMFKLALLIIEVVGSNMLLEIHRDCNESRLCCQMLPLVVSVY